MTVSSPSEAQEKALAVTIWALKGLISHFNVKGYNSDGTVRDQTNISLDLSDLDDWERWLLKTPTVENCLYGVFV